MTATTGETIYCGPADDPFFVDLGGIFDLGQTRAGAGPRDGVGNKNVHTIAIKAPIATLQKTGLGIAGAKNILDPDFVIGVWASASRMATNTLALDGSKPTPSGAWIQVSRIGMPLTNEAVIPIGSKDRWNALTPYTEDKTAEDFFCNPELALYMDDSQFGGAVPALSALRIQTKSLGSYDFRNKAAGLSGLLATNGGKGTALDTNAFGKYLLRPGKPRSVDILPIFHTGVPNLPPYQLATGKAGGNPLAVGKPFVNNFLPVFGDMLRLNMAVPVTPRSSKDFSSMGLINAAVLGLTDSRFNGNANLQFIPNMDGFPNGRRLEDDVTRIELQAVSGVALAAIGLWYDDYVTGQPATTPKLLGVLGYTTGVEANDTTFKAGFPYVQTPWSGFGRCGGTPYKATFVTGLRNASAIGVSAPSMVMGQNYPNPVVDQTTFKYRVTEAAEVSLTVYDISGKKVATLVDGEVKQAGNYEVVLHAHDLRNGIYIATLATNSHVVQSFKFNVSK
jgi:hypothetical protein